MKYKIIVALTFLLPISSYLLYSAFTGQTYDATIKTDNTINVLNYDDGFVVFSEDAIYNGYMIPYDDSYALYVDEGDIVKIGREYFTIHDGLWKNIDDIPPTMEEQNDTVTAVITIIGIIIVILIIGGKMDLLKSHPRASAMFSLLLGTLILWAINSIVSNLLNVFIVATVTWAAYLIEYGIHQGKIDQLKGNKIESDIVSSLKELLSK